MNDPKFQPITCGRTLLVSWGLPPDIQGSSAIAEKLSRLFDRDALLMAGEAAVGAEGYRRDEHLPPVHYVAKEWRRKGRKYVRRMSFPAILYRLWRLTGREKFDRVIGVFPDETYLLAAYLVARWRRLEFFPFFHNTYVENREGWLKRLAVWLQGRIFTTSPLVLVANDGMKQFYEPAYPDVRFETLHHVNEVEGPPPGELPPPHDPLRLTYVGSVNQSNLDAFSRLGQFVSTLNDYVLTIYTGQAESAFDNLGFDPAKKRHTSVPYHELPAALQEHDVVLLPHGFRGGLSEVEYQTIFPTRTIPCLLSGRPILAHSPPDCFFTRWLKEHDCAEVVDVADVEALRQALQRLTTDEDRRRQLVANASRAVQCFSPASVAEHLQAIFEETYRPRRPADTPQRAAEGACTTS